MVKPDFDRTKWDWVTTQKHNSFGIKPKLDDYAGRKLQTGEYRVVKKMRKTGVTGNPIHTEYIGLVRKI